MVDGRQEVTRRSGGPTVIDCICLHELRRRVLLLLLLHLMLVPAYRVGKDNRRAAATPDRSTAVVRHDRRSRRRMEGAIFCRAVSRCSGSFECMFEVRPVFAERGHRAITSLAPSRPLALNTGQKRGQQL